MNIFIRELKGNIKSIIIWSVIILLFVVIGFSKFSAYAGNPELLAILDNMPQAVLESLSLKAFDLTTITGFYGIFYLYFSLLLSIAAAMWGSDFISKEERDKTVEFSLTMPVTRGKVITGKALAAVVSCLVLNIVTLAATYVASSSYNPDEKFYNFVVLSNVSIFILQLIFLALGIFLGSAMKYYRRANSTAMSILLATFFMFIIAGLSEKLDWLKYFTPFKYFDPLEILNKSRIDPNFVLLSVGIIMVLMVGAYLTYSKRDLYI
jgi:ABC-2 type transport system permease protein